MEVLRLPVLNCVPDINEVFDPQDLRLCECSKVLFISRDWWEIFLCAIIGVDITEKGDCVIGVVWDLKRVVCCHTGIIGHEKTPFGVL